MSETVNHPPHYNKSLASCDKCGDSIECIEVVRHFNFNLGNVIKYIWRAGLKNSSTRLEDLRKAAWYLNDEIAFWERETKESKTFPNIKTLPEYEVRKAMVRKDES